MRRPWNTEPMADATVIVTFPVIRLLKAGEKHRVDRTLRRRLGASPADPVCTVDLHERRQHAGPPRRHR